MESPKSNWVQCIALLVVAAVAVLPHPSEPIWTKPPKPTNFPKTMKNARKSVHFVSVVWPTKNTNSAKIIRKILFHIRKCAQSSVILCFIRNSPSSHQSIRATLAHRHHHRHLKCPYQRHTIHIVLRPATVFGHHADHRLAIDSWWCHHQVKFLLRSKLLDNFSNVILIILPARSCFGMKSPSCTRAATMSPRSQPSMKRPYYDTLMENNLILSPRSDDCDNNLGKPCVQPLSEVKPSNIDVRTNQPNAMDNRNSTDTDKPMCSIKLIRRYVEEDDAASVITSEEGIEIVNCQCFVSISANRMRFSYYFAIADDCISPGYHTSLPLEVHGAGYSDMQMVSKMSYKKLLCPTVTVTQTTFDLEAFTYYAVNYLCCINNRKYGFFFDCACEIVKVSATNIYHENFPYATQITCDSNVLLPPPSSLYLSPPSH